MTYLKGKEKTDMIGENAMGIAAGALSHAHSCISLSGDFNHTHIRVLPGRSGSPAPILKHTYYDYRIIDNSIVADLVFSEEESGQDIQRPQMDE